VPSAYLPSDSDRRLLQQLLDAFRRGLLNVPQRPHPEEPRDFTPDVYVALTPAGGVPGRVGGVPGSADCTLYRLLPDASGVLTLADVGLPAKTVYNLADAAIGGAEYVEIRRDKWGSWWAGSGGAGSLSCPPVSFEETDLRCEAGAGTSTGTGSGVLHHLNLYRRGVVLSHGPSGCLSRSEGAWVFIRAVSCCDPACAVTPEECPCWDELGTYVCVTVTGVGYPAGAVVSGFRNDLITHGTWTGVSVYPATPPIDPGHNVAFVLRCDDGVPSLHLGLDDGGVFGDNVVLPLVSYDCVTGTMTFAGTGYGGVFNDHLYSSWDDNGGNYDVTAVVTRGSCGGPGSGPGGETIPCPTPCAALADEVAPGGWGLAAVGFTDGTPGGGCDWSALADTSLATRIDNCNWTGHLVGMAGTATLVNDASTARRWVLTLFATAGSCTATYVPTSGPPDGCVPWTFARTTPAPGCPDALTLLPCGGCCGPGCAGTGTGGGGGGDVCGILDAPLGHADNGGSGATATLAGITVPAGLLIANVGQNGTDAFPLSATFDGVAMTLKDSVHVSGGVGVAQYYLHVTTPAAGNLVVTRGGSTTSLEVSAVSVTGLADNAPSGAAVTASGAGTTPALTGIASAACSYNQASFCVTPATAGGWSAPYADGGQDAVLGADRLVEGFYRDAAGGTLTATYGGIAPTWAGINVNYT
jgi:hypothetical protein